MNLMRSEVFNHIPALDVTMIERKNGMGNIINRGSVIEAIGKNTCFNDIIDIINSLPLIQLDTTHILKREPIRDKFNCPNCGAPISNTECPYCGSVFGV